MEEGGTTYQYYDQLHPNVALVLCHNDFQEDLIPSLSNCDWELFEESKILTLSSSHHHPDLPEWGQVASSIKTNIKCNKQPSIENPNSSAHYCLLEPSEITLTKCAIGSPHLILSFNILSSSGSSLRKSNFRDRRKKM